jgi:oligopeptide transport system substrate-binding protein
MNKRTIIFSVLFLGLISLGYLAWTKFKFGTSSPSLLSLALDNAFDSLDPSQAYSDDSLIVSAQVLEPLFQYHYLKRPYEIQPLVAEALPQFEEKGLVLKIKILKGISFHDHPAFKGKSRYLKAEDFVNQFKRLAMKSLKSPGRSLFSGLVLGFDDYGQKINENWKKIKSTPLEGVTAVDDQTLMIKMSRSEPNMIYYLALNFAVPVPWEIIEFFDNKLDKTLVGTGPYEYSGFSSNFFSMKKFAKYRLDYYPSSGDRYANVEKLLVSSKEKIPFIDEVRFYVTSQEEERWQKFLKREIDLLTVPKTFIPKLYDPNGELSAELKSKDVKLMHFPILANRWLSFNMRNPLLGKNDFLRRAIAYSIDYTKYVQVLSQNTNLRANSILVPGISGYLPAKDFRFKYDPALAKAYLKQAGFDKPEKMPTITYSTRGNQSIHLLEAEFIKTHLEAIGLKVKIEVLAFPDFIRKGRAGELMFFTDNWLFDYPDGENILQLLVSRNFPGVNKSAYSNPLIDKLYDELKQTTSLDQRDRIIQQMEEIVFNDLPWIPMMYESSFVLQYPEIKNFRKSSIIRNYVKYLKIER